MLRQVGLAHCSWWPLQWTRVDRVQWNQCTECLCQPEEAQLCLRSWKASEPDIEQATQQWHHGQGTVGSVSSKEPLVLATMFWPVVDGHHKLPLEYSSRIWLCIDWEGASQLRGSQSVHSPVGGEASWDPCLQGFFPMCGEWNHSHLVHHRGITCSGGWIHLESPQHWSRDSRHGCQIWKQGFAVPNEQALLRLLTHQSSWGSQWTVASADGDQPLSPSPLQSQGSAGPMEGELVSVVAHPNLAPLHSWLQMQV